MSDLMRRATSAKRRAASALRHVPQTRELTADEERELGAEYAFALGLHLSPDQQLARFKGSTEGAPVVRRPLRRRPV